MKPITNNHSFRSKYGPWALVAGASEGLGAAFSRELAKRGLNLVLIARRAEKLKELAANILESFPVEIKYFPLDLSNIDEVRKVVRQSGEEINLLVYNAAFAPIGNFEDIREQELERIIDINIRAPLLLSKILSEDMIRRRKGGIVFMSSLAGIQGSPKIATYAASKAFNTILAEGLWCELIKHGIDVLASSPGAVATPGYNQAQARKAPGTLDAQTVVIRTLNALGKKPVFIPGTLNMLAGFFMRRIFPRKLAIRIMEKNTNNLS